MKITCDRLDALLPDFFDGNLDEPTREAAVKHMATCDDCRVVVADLTRVGDLAREHGRLELPEDTKRRIRRMLADRGSSF